MGLAATGFPLSVRVHKVQCLSDIVTQLGTGEVVHNCHFTFRVTIFDMLGTVPAMRHLLGLLDSPSLPSPSSFASQRLISLSLSLSLSPLYYNKHFGMHIILRDGIVTKARRRLSPSATFVIRANAGEAFSSRLTT